MSLSAKQQGRDPCEGVLLIFDISCLQLVYFCCFCTKKFDREESTRLQEKRLGFGKERFIFLHNRIEKGVDDHMLLFFVLFKESAFVASSDAVKRVCECVFLCRKLICVSRQT